MQKSDEDRFASIGNAVFCVTKEVTMISDIDRIFVVVIVIGFPAGRVAPCPTTVASVIRLYLSCQAHPTVIMHPLSDHDTAKLK